MALGKLFSRVVFVIKKYIIKTPGSNEIIRCIRNTAFCKVGITGKANSQNNVQNIFLDKY